MNLTKMEPAQRQIFGKGHGYTMALFERLEQLFVEIEAKTGLKKNRVLLEAGIDPAQYRAYKRASRLLSDDMLDRLGKFSAIHVSQERLKAWKAIDAFGPAVIFECIAVLREEGALP